MTSSREVCRRAARRHIETVAMELFLAGAEVTIAVRDLDAGQEAADDIAESDGRARAAAHRGRLGAPVRDQPPGPLRARHGLHDALVAAGGARIVSVSSSGHHASPVVFEDITFERREYHPWSAYGRSKTANALFAVEATRRWSGDGIFASSRGDHAGGAVAPELDGVGGLNLEDGGGVRRWALDPEAANRLWEVSLEILR